MKTKKNYLLIVAFLLVVIITVIGIYNADKKKAFNIESKIAENNRVFPVLYYEEGIGGPGYNTFTFLIDGNEAVALEDHNRTFSRTYPSSAYERFSKNEAVYGEYGRILVYYNTPDGEIFVFESYKENLLTLIKNDIKTEIFPKDGEAYFDFLYFDGHYYLFTLAQPDILRTYMISEDFAVEKTFDIDYGSLGIEGNAFINNSLCVVDETLVVMIENRLLRYDINSGKTDINPVGYWLFGVAADNEHFYTIGHTYTGEIVFEKFAPKGESLCKWEEALPFGFGYDSMTFSTGDTYYMYGSEIYFEFSRGEKDYIASYDLKSCGWTNQWIIEKEAKPLLPANIKFMIKDGEDYYDLFPHWNNS